MWDLPGPGLESVFPALAGGFLTTAPPGKSLLHIFESRLLLLLVSFRSSLYILDINPYHIYNPYQIYDLKIISSIL